MPQRIAGERARELREMAHAKGLRHRSARVGSEARVAVEGDGATGMTGDYLRVGVRHERTGPPDDGPGALQDGRDGSQVGAGVPEKGRRTAPMVRGTLLGDGDDLYIVAPRDSARIQA